MPWIWISSSFLLLCKLILLIKGCSYISFLRLNLVCAWYARKQWFTASNLKAASLTVMFNLMLLVLTSRTFEPCVFFIAESLVLLINLSPWSQHRYMLSKVRLILMWVKWQLITHAQLAVNEPRFSSLLLWATAHCRCMACFKLMAYSHNPHSLSWNIMSLPNHMVQDLFIHPLFQTSV